MPSALIYFDHIAATPMDPRVLEAMLPFFGPVFGNPQSFYANGARAKEAIDQARAQVAGLIGARPEEIIFTASGTESNNLALKGFAAAQAGKGKHIIVSGIEHSSVLNVAKSLAKSGFAVTYLPVDKYGMVKPEDVAAGIRPDTILISVMTANNEVGTIQPVAAIGKIARERNIVFHTDAVAAAGMIPINVLSVYPQMTQMSPMGQSAKSAESADGINSVASLPVDMLSLAAQNFYGPKGVAALYVRKGVRIQPQLEGGVQENNRRAGTENVPGIVGMGKAAELAAAEMTERSGKLKQLRDRLLQELPRRLERVYISGHPAERLPGHASFCLEFVEGEGMLLFLEDAGIATASVSACTSKTLRESYVLIAMGYDHALAQGSLILTLGPENTLAEIDHFLDALPPIVERLRRMSPLYARYLKDPAAYDASKANAEYCEPEEHGG